MTDATLHDGSIIEIEVDGEGPTLLLPVNPQPVTGPQAEAMRQWGRPMRWRSRRRLKRMKEPPINSLPSRPEIGPACRSPCRRIRRGSSSPCTRRCKGSTTTPSRCISSAGHAGEACGADPAFVASVQASVITCLRARIQASLGRARVLAQTL